MRDKESYDVMVGQILSLLREEIRQRELPICPEQMPTDKYDDVILAAAEKKVMFGIGAKTERQAILKALES